MPAAELSEPERASLAARVRIVGMVEGISYLLLLGVAMPLKHLADMPMAVTYVGWIHGVLFIAYGVVALHATVKIPLPFVRLLVLFGAALVPFGPFVANHRIPELAARNQ